MDTEVDVETAVLPYPFHRPSATEPPPVYHELRAQCPVAKVRFPSGDEGYLVSRYEDVYAVLADPRFSRAATVAPDAPKLTATQPIPGSLFTMTRRSTPGCAGSCPASSPRAASRGCCRASRS